VPHRTARLRVANRQTSRSEPGSSAAPSLGYICLYMHYAILFTRYVNFGTQNVGIVQR
jgi:hypothetical protein